MRTHWLFSESFKTLFVHRHSRGIFSLLCLKCLFFSLTQRSGIFPNCQNVEKTGKGVTLIKGNQIFSDSYLNNRQSRVPKHLTRAKSAQVNYIMWRQVTVYILSKLFPLFFSREKRHLKGKVLMILRNCRQNKPPIEMWQLWCSGSVTNF